MYGEIVQYCVDSTSAQHTQIFVNTTTLTQMHDTISSSIFFHICTEDYIPMAPLFVYQIKIIILLIFFIKIKGKYDVIDFKPQHKKNHVKIAEKSKYCYVIFAPVQRLYMKIVKNQNVTIYDQQYFKSYMRIAKVDKRC